MIKFFRKIRHNLIKEQKLGKYLIYAIGEIILVVIGILIALQLNNRNEYNKSLDNSNVYLREIVNDLASDTLYLNRMVLNLKKQSSLEDWYLEKTSYTLTDFDSLKSIFPIGIWDFYVEDRTYSKIQNSQESKLVGYKELYKNITDYYSVSKKRIEKNTKFEIREASKQVDFIERLNKTIEFNAYKTRDFSGVTLKGNFPQMPQKEKDKNNFIALMNKIEARNYLKSAYERHLLLLLGFDLTKEKATDLISDINSSLNE